MTPLETLQPLLHSIQQHVQLAPAEVAQLQQHIQQRRVRKGQVLIFPSMQVGHTWFVRSGSLRLFLTDRDGNEHILQLAMEGWWIGDKRSFDQLHPSQLTLEALEDCDLLECSRQSLYHLFDTVPAMERYFRIMAQNAYIAFQQRVLQNLSLPAEERYRLFHARYAALEPRLSQKNIASYLGITPEYLSRIKKEMRLKETHS